MKTAQEFLAALASLPANEQKRVIDHILSKSGRQPTQAAQEAAPCPKSPQQN